MNYKLLGKAKFLEKTSHNLSQNNLLFQAPHWLSSGVLESVCIRDYQKSKINSSLRSWILFFKVIRYFCCPPWKKEQFKETIKSSKLPWQPCPRYFWVYISEYTLMWVYTCFLKHKSIPEIWWLKSCVISKWVDLCKSKRSYIKNPFDF